MEFEQFKEKLVEDLQNRFEGQGVSIKTSHVDKINGSYEALTVTKEESNVGMNLNLDNVYSKFDQGAEYNEVLNDIHEVIEDNMSRIPAFDLAMLTDYESVKDKLVMQVVSAETNAEKLESIPHKNMEDLAVIYRIVVDESVSERASFVVSNNLMEQYGITPEQLHQDALANAPEINPMTIKGITEVMAEMMGPNEELMLNLKDASSPAQDVMYVASVPDHIHGASVLAYEDFMDKASERAGGDFYILPSSINEILIVPDNGEHDVEALKEMVRQVNETEVSPEEKLSDNVYHYDSKEKIFETADKYVDRMQQKEEVHDNSEKPQEKSSVIKDLKANKAENKRAEITAPSGKSEKSMER